MIQAHVERAAVFNRGAVNAFHIYETDLNGKRSCSAAV